MVQVVSMLEVMIRLGERVFQSKEVNGAVCSGDFELDNNASGVSLNGAGSRLWWLEVRVMELLVVLDGVALAGSDQSRRWSPDVANKSVDCF